MHDLGTFTDKKVHMFMLNKKLFAKIYGLCKISINTYNIADVVKK